jgi:glutathione synthase/RimK-type ligase-like ATP-grasp enzyme
MKKCALLTCDDLTGFVTDEQYLEKALVKSGWTYDWISWTQDNVDWQSYDFAIIRTTWDYAKNRQPFLKNLNKIEDSTCRLLNPLNLVEWNIDKIYLKSLQESGIQIVPTLWTKYSQIDVVAKAYLELNSDKIVVKPRVGAGAANTFLISQNVLHNFTDNLNLLEDTEIMLQPYMSQISLIGEFSVHFFAGEFSHAILKKPKAGDFRSQEEFGSHVKLIDLTARQMEFCHSVINKIQGPWLYARVDFVYNDKMQECLMELELIEPSLYFRYKEGSAELLVDKLNQF